MTPKETDMQNNTPERIEVLYTEDSLFSGWKTSGIDIRASVMRYGDIVYNRLCREYNTPAHHINVKETINDQIRVDGWTTDNRCIDIAHTLEDIYNNQEWLVFTDYTVALNAGITMHATITGPTNVYAACDPDPNLSYCKQALPPHTVEWYDTPEELAAKMEELAHPWYPVA